MPVSPLPLIGKSVGAGIGDRQGCRQGNPKSRPDPSASHQSVWLAWFDQDARRSAILIIAISLMLRLIFAATTSLGTDESYTIATGRVLAMSTYDHPPIAWWLAWLSTHLFRSDASLVARAPFLLLFVWTSWSMYRLGATLFGARAGLYSLAVLSCAPVLGVTSATWVLPDGPLMAGLVAGALTIARLLFEDRTPPSRWLLAGFYGGLALLSKYHGIFLFAGTGLFLLTSPRHRHWLTSPWPYAGFALAAAMFVPVIIWNIEHDWASFAFQGGRAVARVFRPWMPVVMLAGQALFLMPTIWLGLAIGATKAARLGPEDERRWLLFCLGVGPVAIFTIFAIWSKHVMFHWAAPGYLLWIPLLGCELAQQLARRSAPWRNTAFASAGLTPSLVIIFSFLSMAPVPWSRLHMRDPLVEMRDWSGVPAYLARHGMLRGKGVFLASEHWQESGKLGYVMKGEMPVTCLSHDMRGFGVIAPLTSFVGDNGIVFIRSTNVPAAKLLLREEFSKISRMDDLVISHKGQLVARYAVFYGEEFHPS